MPADKVRTSQRRGWVPALFLFFLAPLFGEFLLGNLRLSELALLPFLALLYGSGAIVIRETARRMGRGYGTMLGFAAAYALFEEGIVDQMLFNPAYYPGQIADMQTMVLGLDLWLTLIVTGMHAVWSITIPIILTESLFRRQGHVPWFGPVGFGAIWLVLALGSAWLTWIIWQDSGFFASPRQLSASVLAIAVILVLTLALGSKPRRISTLQPPSPLLVGLLSFAASSGFFLTDGLQGWPRFAIAAIVGTIAMGVLSGWSRHPGWRQAHVLAATGGAIATYAWLGATMQPESGPKLVFDHVGTAVLIVLAAGLWYRAWRNVGSDKASAPADTGSF